MLTVISFYESLSRTSKLSKSTRILLDVFAFYMRDSDNLFFLGEDYVEQYLKVCKEKLKIDYSAKTLREAISELLKNEIIFRFSNNNYVIDPRLYCKPDGYHNRGKILEGIEWNKKYKLAKKEGRDISPYPPN